MKKQFLIPILVVWSFSWSVCGLDLSSILPVKLTPQSQEDLRSIYKIENPNSYAGSVLKPVADLIVLDHELKGFNLADLRAHNVGIIDGGTCLDLEDSSLNGEESAAASGSSSHGDYVVSSLMENAGYAVRTLRIVQVRSALDYLCVADLVRRRNETYSKQKTTSAVQVVVSTVVFPTRMQHRFFIEQVVSEIASMGAIWFQAAGNYADAILDGQFDQSSTTSGTTYAKLQKSSTGTETRVLQNFRDRYGRVYSAYTTASPVTTISDETTFTVSADQTRVHVVLSWGKGGEVVYQKMGTHYLEHNVVRKGGVDLDLEVYDKDGVLIDTHGTGADKQVAGCVNARGIYRPYAGDKSGGTKLVAGVEVAETAATVCGPTAGETYMNEGESILDFEKIVLPSLERGTYKIKVKLKNPTEANLLKGNSFRLAVYTPVIMNLTESTEEKANYSLKFNGANVTSELAAPANKEIFVISDLSALASRGSKDERSPDAYLPSGSLNFDDGFGMEATSFSTTIVAMSMLQKFALNKYVPNIDQAKSVFASSIGESVYLLRTFKDSPWYVGEFNGYVTDSTTDVISAISRDYNLKDKTVVYATKSEDANGVPINRYIFDGQNSSLKRAYWNISTSYQEPYIDTETKYRTVQKVVNKTRNYNHKVDQIALQWVQGPPGLLVTQPVRVGTLSIPMVQHYQDVQTDEVPYQVQVRKYHDRTRSSVLVQVLSDTAKITLPQGGNRQVTSGVIVSDFQAELPKTTKDFLESSKKRGEVPQFWIGSKY